MDWEKQQSTFRLDKDGRTPIPVPLMEWAWWFESADNIVERTVGKTEVGDYTVSTMFLGMNMNYSAKGTPPILFETMIYNTTKTRNSFCDYQVRYSTWQEAQKGHLMAVEIVKLNAKLDLEPDGKEKKKARKEKPKNV